MSLIFEKNSLFLILSFPETPQYTGKFGNKKGPFSKVLLIWWALQDCLGFFALNVSTVFLFRNFVSFKEKTSALCKKSVRTWQGSALHVHKSFTHNKKRSDICHFSFYGGRYKTRTCDPLNVVQMRYQLRQTPLFNC